MYVVNRTRRIADLPVLEASQEDVEDELERIGLYTASTWRPEMED